MSTFDDLVAAIGDAKKAIAEAERLAGKLRYANWDLADAIADVMRRKRDIWTKSRLRQEIAAHGLPCNGNQILRGLRKLRDADRVRKLTKGHGSGRWQGGEEAQWTWTG